MRHLVLNIRKLVDSAEGPNEAPREAEPASGEPR